MAHWWKRLTGQMSGLSARDTARRLHVPEWALVETDQRRAVWRDDAGDVLTLTLLDGDNIADDLSSDDGLRRYCRAVAEAQGAGLVEAKAVTGLHGRGYAFIHKKLRGAGFTFMGMLVVPAANALWAWTVMSGERGMTGVREAIVTGKMIEAGTLTLEAYEASWAQDPYDPGYEGVDRRTLRYMSDAEEYDEWFPEHPLTKVRRELRKLVEIELEPPKTGA